MAAIVSSQEIVLRASGMPLAFRCAGSVRREGMLVNEVHEAADLGTAGHEALRPLAEGGGIHWDELPTIAARYGVEEDDLRASVATAAKLWETVRESFAGALTEVALETEVAPGVVLTGHADLLASSGTVARCGDWKTGRKDRDHAHQMRAYGALVLEDDPSLEEVTVTVLWTRAGDIENYTMKRPAAAAWLAEVRDRVVNWDGTYRPGSHCHYCPRSHECKAANALVRRDVAALMDVDVAAELAVMPPEQIITLRRKVQQVEQIAERIGKAIRAHVEQSGGEIKAPDGTSLVLEAAERRELEPLTAWPVLEQSAGFVDKDFAEVVKLPVTRVEKLVATKAGRGKGAAAIRALNEKLRAVGAIKTSTVHTLEERRGG